MKPHHRSHLVQKGWTKEELQHAEEILERRTQHDLHFSQIVFWSALSVIIFANILVSVTLVIFLIALESWVLYSLVIILAVVIGILYDFLITDIGHLERKHHIAAGIIIPILALINIIGMVILSNKFTSDLHIAKFHDPLIIGLIFAVAFILPYLLNRIRDQFHAKRAVLLR